MLNDSSLAFAVSVYICPTLTLLRPFYQKRRDVTVICRNCLSLTEGRVRHLQRVLSEQADVRNVDQRNWT